MSRPIEPELLAPAGDWEALRAAVSNGANAVYFGLANFNARHRATNFGVEELPEVMRYLHDHNVRGYVAFNTLLFPRELAQAADMIRAMAEARVDAVIVQDLGLARLIRQLAPRLPIHGSTQMTLTEPLGIELVKTLGVDRVILARELSLADIAAIRERSSMPLEVFVHGALCVAYSGQCLTSEALGGRSANRGQCAQACRLPYELVVDGETRDLGDVKYLLSPQDLAAHDLIDPLVKLGVCSFKIEGRLKSAEYVAATSQTYRAALDAAVAGEAFALSPAGLVQLQQSFSRGLSHGFFDGVNHQELVGGRFPKSRGVRMGVVAEKTKRGVVVACDEAVRESPLKTGDGVVFDEGHPEQDEQGGRVASVRAWHGGAGKSAQHLMEVEFTTGSVNIAAIAVGALVWRTDDPRLRKQLEQTFARDTVARREPLHLRLCGQIQGPLALVANDASGRTAEAAWPGPLQVASKHPFMRELAVEQLGRLGDSPFALGQLEVQVPAEAMVPKSVLNDLRRRVVADLLAQRDQALAGPFNAAALPSLRAAAARKHAPANKDTAQLHVLCRTQDQLRAVLEWQTQTAASLPCSSASMVYCDYENVRRYREAVELARTFQRKIGLASLRVLKPHEEGLLAHLAKAAPDAILVRNLGTLAWFREHGPELPLMGDFSLNAANELTVQWLREQGLARVTPSYDLNFEQLTDLLAHTDTHDLEVVVHQHVPMFHMEHCVFAHVLSQGRDYRDCGRPCDTHRVELRDRTGPEFPLLADTGCRNTVFNAVAQSAAEYMPRLLESGVRHFRVELLRETPADVGPLLDRYARVISGLDDGRSTWRALKALNQLGITRGTLQQA